MTNKYYGKKSAYSPLREDYSRIIASYGKEDVNENYATWYEVYFYKKQNPSPSVEQIKDAIIADINSQTDEKILTGFVWNDIPVWLSSENQFNFKAAYDLAVQTQGASLPMKFKLGEDAEGTPIYYTFEDIAEFTDFYTKAVRYINQCLDEGWQKKDNIDWSEYGAFSL